MNSGWDSVFFISSFEKQRSAGHKLFEGERKKVSWDPSMLGTQDTTIGGSPDMDRLPPHALKSCDFVLGVFSLLSRETVTIQMVAVSPFHNESSDRK